MIRGVAVEDADGRQDGVELRFLVVHSSQWASQAAAAYAAAQAKEAAQVAEHIERVEAHGFAGVAEAEAAIAEYDCKISERAAAGYRQSWLGGSGHSHRYEPSAGEG